MMLLQNLLGSGELAQTKEFFAKREYGSAHLTVEARKVEIMQVAKLCQLALTVLVVSVSVQTMGAETPPDCSNTCM